MAVQIATTGDEKVLLQTFTRFKEIPRAEKCKDLPVMIRVKASSGLDQEHWRPSLDLVVMINYDPIRSMLSTTPGLVNQGLMSMIDQLGPRDRLCFVDMKRGMMSLTEMSEPGRTIAKHWVQATRSPKFGKNAAEEASTILKNHGTNESNNRLGCIILIAHGHCELQDTTSNIDFPVYIFGLSDLSDIILGNIKEKTSITCYKTARENFKGMIIQFISELKSVITRGIQIHMKTHKGVIISSVESGGYRNRINAEEGTGMIEIDYLCGGEEKNFIVHLVVSEGVKELMTVDGKCNDNNGEIQLNQTGVCVQRPDRSVKLMDFFFRKREVKDICPHVAAEIIRLGILKSVSNLTHGRHNKTLENSWSEIKKSEDGRNVPEAGLADFNKDIKLIECDSIHRNLWLAHQKWQRASTKALLSNRYASVYVYTPWMNNQHH